VRRCCGLCCTEFVWSCDGDLDCSRPSRVVCPFLNAVSMSCVYFVHVSEPIVALCSIVPLICTVCRPWRSPPVSFVMHRLRGEQDLSPTAV
jgi:hypothetical protein